MINEKNTEEGKGCAWGCLLFILAVLVVNIGGAINNFEEWKEGFLGSLKVIYGLIFVLVGLVLLGMTLIIAFATVSEAPWNKFKSKLIDVLTQIRSSFLKISTKGFSPIKYVNSLPPTLGLWLWLICMILCYVAWFFLSVFLGLLTPVWI